MKLPAPKEPRHVKDWIRSVEQHTLKTPGVRWDSLNVWYGNQLPKYLWEEWKNELRPAGFTWQIFLKLLKHRTDQVLLWHKGIHGWHDLIKEIVDLISGPFGKEIVSRK